MNTTRISLLSGVHAEELPEVARLFDEPGPFLSIHLDTEAADENAPARFARRWANHRRALDAAGAPADLLDQAESWLASERTRGPALSFIGTVGGPTVSVVGPEALGADRVGWDVVPHVAPFVAWHQATPPALLVVVDRTGADLVSGGRAAGRLEEVVGDDAPTIHRGAPGGWSQRRYQQRAENLWRSNTGDVAERVTALVDELDARLVVVAGDVRAVQLLDEQLPPRVRALVRPAAGGRAPGGEGAMVGDARRLYRSLVAEDTVALIETFKEELGQLDRGVAGIGDTLAALSAAAVETLLVHADRADGRRLFFDPKVRLAASVTAQQIVDQGGEYRDGPLVDVAIRAAWSGGGGVRIMPRLPELTDGIGAVLRYARAAVPDVDG